MLKCTYVVLFVLILFLFPLTLTITAQENPFISESLATYLNNELSGDRAFEYIRWMSHYHRPTGSKGYAAVARLIRDWAQEFELENSRIVKQKTDRPNWDALSGELWVVEPEEIKLGSYAEIAVSIPDNCPSAQATVELVDIGRGEFDADFAHKDVTGKAVLTSASPSQAMRTAVWERGAVGIVSYSLESQNAQHDLADEVSYEGVPREGPDGEKAAWAFMISPRKGSFLKQLLRETREDSTVLKIKVDIETIFYDKPEQSYVWAEITGSEIHNQDIVLTSHIQEEKTSANDDGSGCANMLEIGRTITRLVKEGRIPPPKRDIVFWWADEDQSEYQYFRDFPDERKTMLVNINQDMVGAKQSMGSRIQHITRTPWSLPSYLNDVIESIVEYVTLTNTAFLAAGGAGTPEPFSKPILSHLGTRERYGARVVPYFGSSDHVVFCEGIIGVPGVGFINWPDRYIHSTADDLDNIDQTQLKRNAFIVAAATLYLANAGDEDVPLLVSQVYSRALRRIGKNMGIAMSYLQNRESTDLQQSYHEARNLIHQCIVKETKAIESIHVFAAQGGENEAFIRGRVKDVNRLEENLFNNLDELYQLVSGESNAPSLSLTAEEKEMDAKVPERIESVDDYFKNREDVDEPEGLHSLMAWECYNFADGSSSYLDIYKAVHAEAMAAGSFYYGIVSLQAVAQLLDQAVEAGALKLIRGK